MKKSEDVNELIKRIQKSMSKTNKLIVKLLENQIQEPS